jgi:hypothetical protein
MIATNERTIVEALMNAKGAYLILRKEGLDTELPGFAKCERQLEEALRVMCDRMWEGGRQRVMPHCPVHNHFA